MEIEPLKVEFYYRKHIGGKWHVFKRVELPTCLPIEEVGKFEHEDIASAYVEKLNREQGIGL